MHNNKGLANILVIVGIVAFIAASTYLALSFRASKHIDTFEKCKAAGYPIMESYPEQCKSPDGHIFMHEIPPRSASFGSSTTLQIGEQARFDDDLVLTLVEINDSRCKTGVTCIWAGELSPMFLITGGNVGGSLAQIRLGTTTATTSTKTGYKFTLESATETTATLKVTKDESPTPAPAPLPPPSEEKVTLKEGERNGPLLLEKVFSTYITGQVYREYPLATDNGAPITLHIGESASNGCTITLTLISVSTANKTATFTKKSDLTRPCPICLSLGTLIDTPSGQIAVEDLKAGMSVWTTNALGARVSAKLLLTSRTPAPIGHEVNHIVLKDGRELFVSPLHPTSDGRLVGKLIKGDILDGSDVVNTEKILYTHPFTYDILPAGATGAYWANGILMGSTLNVR